jgi:uncharacterized protein (TIGR02001 family)
MGRMQARRPALASFALVAVVATQHGRAGPFGGSLALTSDYVYRGISQTCGDPAFQADVHYRSHGGESPSETFVGLFGSKGLGDSYCGGTSELNAYLGHSFATSRDSSATLTYTHYAYPNGEYGFDRVDYDYDELAGEWAYRDQLFFTLAWVPNALRYTGHSLERGRSAFTAGLQLHQALGASFTLSAGVGYDEVTDFSGAGYAFWNGGIGYGIGRWQLDVSYFGTADHATQHFGTRIAGNRVSATALWRF